MNPRTVGAIALRPVGNGQGSYYFLSVTTGRVLNRLHAAALPMPDEVIDKLHRMVRQQKSNPGLIFADRNLNPDEYDDEEDDETYHEGDSMSDDEDDVLSDDEEDDDEVVEDDEEAEEDDDEVVEDDEEAENPPDNEENDANEIEDEPQAPQAEENDATAVPPPVENDEEANSVDLMAEVEAMEPAEAGPPEDPVNHEAEFPEVPETPGVGRAGEHEEEAWSNDPETPGVGGAGEHQEEAKDQAPTPWYNLRKTRGRDYDHRYDKEDYIIDNVVMTTQGESEVLETPQMSLKVGLRTFGKDGEIAVEKEMRQLHDRGVMIPVHKKNLTPDQRREALAYLMFLKRKRCGKVKGRGCADGRKQRAYITREESTAPTVSTEAVFLTAVIDALESREVAVLDVPGAFMQADIDELVHVRFTGKMVSKLLDIDNDMYSEYVVTEKGEKVMYMELLKALYGTLRAARLFWQKLSKQLIDVWGFTPNKYDDCVVNKTIKGHQMTVVWHVDDLKVSHVDREEVDKFVEQMEQTFGIDAPLTVSRGKVHDYLGMNLDFRVKGEVRIDMEHYIDMMLQDAPEDMDGISNTPAAAHLFKVDSDSPRLLDEERKKIFVHLVMQGLYLSQRGRPDIRTAIAFLCGRLHNPDEDDYKKLTRMIWYLRGTKSLTLILQANDDGLVRWWIDASYAVHGDMKGHTGATLSLGKGGIYSGSWKQRLVARSSTESELIGVYDVLPQVLWTRQFLEEQGWKDSTTVVYQDNTSSILLERNGRSSSTKRTKHMNIRYFYVTDQVKNGTIHVTHCPTEEMIGDFFTKPLQGSLFVKMRNYIMGRDEPGYQVLPRSVLRNHNFNDDDIRKQKRIGTRKCDPHSEAGTSHNHATEDPNSSTKGDSSRNIQRTTRSKDTGDERIDEQRGSGKKEIEPRSYRDVVVNNNKASGMVT